NRSTQRESGLLPREWRLYRGSPGAECEGVSRIERLVTEKTEDVAVNRVAAGFRNDINQPAGSASELCRVIGTVDLKFLNRLLTHRRSHSGDGIVIIVHAVDRDTVGSTALACERQTRGGRLRQRKCHQTGGIGDARCQQREIQKIALID